MSSGNAAVQELQPVVHAPQPEPSEHLALPSWAAPVFVFLASASVMAIEVLALRLIAPYIGITLETSSAVIGTTLAAIALGAWAGGHAADTANPRRALGVVLLLSGIATLLVLPTVRWAGVYLHGTSKVAVVTLAAIAVIVPATLLSSISPLIIKLQLRDLSRTGSIVGKLSGISTLGGIMATFLVGFVAVSMLPSSVIVLTIGIVLSLAGLLSMYFLAPKRPRLRSGSLGVVAAIAGVGLTLEAPQACDIETAYQCAKVLVDPARASGRVLMLGNSEHSYIDLADPEYLQYSYVQGLAAAAETIRPANGRGLRVLHIGGGGMALPMYLAAMQPDSEQVVYEIDAGVLDIDRRQLGLRESNKLRVHQADGRVGLRYDKDGPYDVVVGDAFGHHSPPWHLTTREALSEARRQLRKGGLYVSNLIDFPPGNFAKAELATLRDVFPHVLTMATTAALEGKDGSNFITVASDHPIDVDAVRAHLNAWKNPPEYTLVLADEAQTAEFAKGGLVMTDDFAPIERLVTIPFQYW